jgi:diadenosine tetraphosphate (Ap4A) HIT family hydrolase
MADCQGCAIVAGAAQSDDLVAELPHSWLLLGAHQAFPGYGVLWSKAHAKELHHLSPAAYAGFMDDLRRASAAVEAASACWKLNVVSLGNVVQHAHAHLMPRAADDPLRLRHPWAHEARFDEAGEPGQRRAMIGRLRQALKEAP